MTAVVATRNYVCQNHVHGTETIACPSLTNTTQKGTREDTEIAKKKKKESSHSWN
jgi:hypothetical protein